MKKAPLKLVLSVKAEKWRAEDPDSYEKDEAFQAVRPRVLKEDDFTCRACGFRADKWQEVHHINDDHSDNSITNLATLCSFCHMTQHIGLAGKNKEALLVWLPEISQPSLHHIVRAILVAEYEGNKPGADKITAAAAKALKDKLLSRESDAKKIIGTSNPEVLGDILWRMANESGNRLYPRREMMLNGIRLLPRGVRKDGNKDVMSEMVQTWISPPKGVYSGSRGSKDWKRLLTATVGSL